MARALLRKYPRGSLFLGEVAHPQTRAFQTEDFEFSSGMSRAVVRNPVSLGRMGSRQELPVTVSPDAHTSKDGFVPKLPTQSPNPRIGFLGESCAP